MRSNKYSSFNNTNNNNNLKISYGIIITRINDISKHPEAILVRGRYTYEFADFVHGRYNVKDISHIMKLIDSMSVNERLDLYSLNFAQMWYRIWLSSDKPELYNKKFAKFQTSWMNDNGAYLRKLIKRSKPLSNDRIGFEFPKGRKESPKEPDINCAIREIEEETGISKKDYQIIPGIKRKISYMHMGVRYIYIYYAAIAKPNIKVCVDFQNFVQLSEISEVQWMGIEKIRILDYNDNRLERTVKPIFNYIKKYMRGEIPHRDIVFRTKGSVYKDSPTENTIKHINKLNKLNKKTDDVRSVLNWRL